MARGGARPGAGRKPKAEKFETAISRAEKRIVDKLPDLIDNMMDLAAGVVVEETDANGDKKIYERPPDRQACEYLINRIMGRPTERSEQEIEGGLDIVVRYEKNDRSDITFSAQWPTMHS